MERALRQSLEISQGSFTIFLTNPISAVLLALAALVLITPTFKFFKKSKEVLAADEEYK
jgi:putative tricarboxylic transport membrane protein